MFIDYRFTFIKIVAGVQYVCTHTYVCYVHRYAGVHGTHPRGYITSAAYYMYVLH